ncbi:MAG: signal peptidase I [Actinomycetes bacterium]
MHEGHSSVTPSLALGRLGATVRSLAPLVLIAALIGCWWMLAAPASIGGPATFALVEGHSMQPLLRTGDLAVAHREHSYAVGDLVIVRVASNFGVSGLVIHRLVSGNAATGWKTKGDNNSWVDPWTVKNNQIAGKYFGGVPRFGAYLGWVNQHSLQFAAICAGLALLSYVPWRRRKLAPELAVALAHAKRESRRDGRSNGEYGVLILSALATMVCLALVGLLGVSHNLVSFRGVVAAISLAWSGGTCVYLIYRLYDGHGVVEPSKSMYALSGRLRLVEDFPDLGELQPVGSAVALRGIAEKYRLPVLHRIDAANGDHEFLLITAQHGTYVWGPRLGESADLAARHVRKRHFHIGGGPRLISR